MNSRTAVERLMRFHSLDGNTDAFIDGYETEIDHMLKRRLMLLDPEEAARVLATRVVVPLKMQLEPKKDGRSKARLVRLGYREPDEWDVKSNASPVAFPSTIKSLMYKAGPADDVMSCIDVSVAFLQSDEYGPDEPDRYVSCSPYKGGPVYVMKMKGCIYGQRSAPRYWYDTLTQWLTDKDGMGYVQGENEPCYFVHPVTGHQIVL